MAIPTGNSEDACRRGWVKNKISAPSKGHFYQNLPSPAQLLINAILINTIDIEMTKSQVHTDVS